MGKDGCGTDGRGDCCSVRHAVVGEGCTQGSSVSVSCAGDVDSRDGECRNVEGQIAVGTPHVGTTATTPYRHDIGAQLGPYLHDLQRVRSLNGQEAGKKTKREERKTTFKEREASVARGGDWIESAPGRSC